MGEGRRVYTCVQAPNQDRCTHRTASLPKPRSGPCGTWAREAPQPRGRVASPSPTICSRSDTHSGLLQAFFFCPQEPAPPAGALASGLCGLLLPPPARLPISDSTSGHSAASASGQTTPSSLQVPSPDFAAVQAFLLKPGQGLWSPQIFLQQGPGNQHKRDHIGFRVWPLTLHPLLWLQGRTPASPALSLLQHPTCP